MIKEKKTDRRSLYTQMVIKTELLKILARKPLNQVTVAELCKAAEINRGTFYTHYYDVFDAYENIENEFFEEVVDKLSEFKIYAWDSTFYNQLMLFISQNTDFMTVIIADIGTNSLLKKIIAYVRAKYVAEFSERYPHIEMSILETVFTYTLNGSIALLTDWIRQGQQQPYTSIAHNIASLSNSVLKSLPLEK